MQCGHAFFSRILPHYARSHFIPTANYVYGGNTMETWLYSVYMCSVITLQIYLKQFCSVEQKEWYWLYWHFATRNLILAKQSRNKRKLKIEIRHFVLNVICMSVYLLFTKCNMRDFQENNCIAIRVRWKFVFVHFRMREMEECVQCAHCYFSPGYVYCTNAMGKLLS